MLIGYRRQIDNGNIITNVNVNELLTSYNYLELNYLNGPLQEIHHHLHFTLIYSAATLSHIGAKSAPQTHLDCPSTYMMVES